MQASTTYLTRTEQVPELIEDYENLKKVTEKFCFRASRYYLSLIDWNDPVDPIRRIVIPSCKELEEWGTRDASREILYTPVPGLQHKYGDTAVLLVSNICGGFCRFCFRKRIFSNTCDEVRSDIDEGLEYVRNHSEITNILLTGGDPLMLSTQKIEEILRRIREIEHVRIIRIGSKIPAYNPLRIISDPGLLEILSRYSESERKIYLMSHFNHPRELTPEAIEAVDRLSRAGIPIANQTPMLAGVNDDPEVLSELFRKLSFLGIPPYYIFQCRPAFGNRTFSVPIEKAYEIFHQAQKNCSGLAKRAKYVLSHVTGKVEVVALTERHIIFRYHRIPDPDKSGKLMVFRRNPEALWLDDYTKPVNGYSADLGFIAG